MKGGFALGLCEGVSTFLGVGRLPEAPGTWGSAAGVFIFLLLRRFLSKGQMAVFVFFLFVLGAFCSDIYSKKIGVKDPSEVVVDEVVGMMVALLPFDGTMLLTALSFVFFRALDILKPFPVGLFDRKLKGGIGIMADDIVAAIYSTFLIMLLKGFFGV